VVTTGGNARKEKERVEREKGKKKKKQTNRRSRKRRFPEMRNKGSGGREVKTASDLRTVNRARRSERRGGKENEGSKGILKS